MDDPLTGVPIALVPALDAGGDHITVSESAFPCTDARDDIAPCPLAELASPLECSVYCSGPSSLNAPGTTNFCAREPDPAVFTPERGVCHDNAVSVGAVSLPAWLCSMLRLPSGSPLPRTNRLELRDPSDALFYVQEFVPPDGMTSRYGVVYIHDPVAAGLTSGRALSCPARAYREIFRAFASSPYYALLLQPLGCARLPLFHAAQLSMAAIQVGAGCLDATCSTTLQSRPLGMLVSSSAALDARLTRATTHQADILTKPLQGGWSSRSSEGACWGSRSCRLRSRAPARPPRRASAVSRAGPIRTAALLMARLPGHGAGRSGGFSDESAAGSPK